MQATRAIPPTRTPRILTVLAASAACWLGPAAAGAQPAAPAAPTAEVSADALLERAEVLTATPSRWHEAALLYQESARMVAADDPAAVRSLRRSAQLLFSLGNPALAVDALERAGSVALVNGDPFLAAECLLEAAWVSQQRGAIEDADRFARMVGTLAASPRVSDLQRASLLGRMATREAVAVR